MDIIGVQLNTVWEDKAANRDRVTRLLADADAPAGSLIVLPETFATGFSMAVSEIAEPPSGETGEFLAETARRHDSYVLGGVAGSAPDGRGLNDAVVYDPDGGGLARSAKVDAVGPGGEEKQ